MRKSVKVVMLPAQGKSELCIQANGVIKIGAVGVGTYQHLYFTSDEKIK